MWKGWNIVTSNRIEKLIKQTAYPESNSVYQAMLQVWNECQQEFNKQTCENCKWFARFKDKDYGDCYGKTKSDTTECHKDFGCVNWKIRFNFNKSN